MTFVLGFTICIAAIGALLSRSAAKKEGVSLVTRHCTWIFRSIYMFILLLVTIGLTGLILMGGAFPTFPDVTQVQSFADIWQDAELRLAVQYSAAYVLAIIMVLIWFLYRMFRGAAMLLLLRVPKA